MNDREKFGVRKVTATYVLLGLIIFFVSCSDSETSKSNTDVTGNGELKHKKDSSQSSREKAEVHINEYVLNIPNWYIAENPPDDRNFVSLHVYWPGMIPYIKNEKSQHDRLDRIEILLDGNFVESEWKKKNTFNRLKQDASFLPKIFREDLGLWEYRRRDPRLDSWSGWYYVPISSYESYSDRRISIINCGGPERIKRNPESIQCQVDYFFRENLVKK